MEKKKDPTLPTVYFRPSESVPETGVYEVYHGDHRGSHLVTLIAGSEFPICKTCGPKVHFELVRGVPLADDAAGFRLALYEVPHPQDDESGSQVA